MLAAGQWRPSHLKASHRGDEESDLPLTFEQLFSWGKNYSGGKEANGVASVGHWKTPHLRNKQRIQPWSCLNTENFLRCFYFSPKQDKVALKPLRVAGICWILECVSVYSNL